MVINLGIGALSLYEIARCTRASLSPAVNSTHVPARLVTNSKEITAGDVFCALRGKADGHDFIEEALARGASAIICESAPHPSLPTLSVDSVVLALGAWARHALDLHKPTVIAITGSVGKTTTKNTLAALLAANAPTHATEGNQNNSLGVPFTVLSAPVGTRFLVAECGTDHPGEIRQLSSLLQPDIAVITCIGHAHIGTFGSREAIAKEKLAIARHMRGGTLFVPFGEPLTAFAPSENATSISVNLPKERERTALGLADTDLPALWALAYTEAIARHLGLSFEKSKANLTQAAHSRRKEFWEKGVLWIDDCYNASPESVYAAILSFVPHTGEKILILGDMLELGDKTPAMHRSMGKLAILHANICFFFGAYASYYAEGARSAGGASRTGARRYFQILNGTAEEMAQSILPFIRKGSAVLAKASRALRAEDVLYQTKEMYVP